MGEELLRRYVKHMLLVERRSGRKVLESLKNQIVRDIMYLVTGKVDRVSVGVDKLSYDELDHIDVEEEKIDSAYLLYGYPWRKKVDIADLDENEREWVADNPEIDVSVTIIYDDVRKNYNVSGGSMPAGSEVGIDITVEFPMGWQEKNFQALQAELGNTVLHELEHLTQSGSTKGFDRGERYYDFSRVEGVTSPMAKDYFLKPDEVAAHVTGYSDAASSMEDLESRMRDDLGKYADRHAITHDEVDLILHSWLDWAQKNLHKKRFM